MPTRSWCPAPPRSVQALHILAKISRRSGAGTYRTAAPIANDLGDRIVTRASTSSPVVVAERWGYSWSAENYARGAGCEFGEHSLRPSDYFPQASRAARRLRIAIQYSKLVFQVRRVCQRRLSGRGWRRRVAPFSTQRKFCRKVKPCVLYSPPTILKGSNRRASRCGERRESKQLLTERIPRNATAVR